MPVNDFNIIIKAFTGKTLLGLHLNYHLNGTLPHQPVGGDISPVITAETSSLAVLDSIEGLYNTI